MTTQMLQYDLLWIQSIPSISNIYYLKYLKDTHVIHCPEKDLPIRAVARSILSTIRSHETKKVALYFEQPCSEMKRKSIFGFVLKHIPNLTCFCLSVPCTPLQPSLLLGWSAGLTDPNWKKLCSAAYDPEAFLPFQPPTAKSGQSACNDFDTMFAVSATKFSGEVTLATALFVHFTDHLLSFDADQGLVLSENVENAIRGWIEASQHQFKTLIWIIDEKKLYGDAIYNINQTGRDTLLQKYRQLISDRVESFNTVIPVYCYILDYFGRTCFNLMHCLAQLQHRHNLNIAGSTLLTWSRDETTSLDDQSFYTLKCIHLQQKPLFNTSKWKYIQPLDDDLTNAYKIPLLKSSDNCLPLTKSEPLITNIIRHTVSAKTVEIFNSWADLGLKQDLEPVTDEDAIPSTWNDVSVEPFEAKEKPDRDAIHKEVLQSVISSLTKEKINAFIGNVIYIERGLELKRQVTQLSVKTEDDAHVQMMASIPIESSSGFITSTIFFSKQNETYKLVKAKCTCPIGNWGNCKHCAAVILYALDQRVVGSPPGDTHNEDEPSSSLLAKRSYDASEEDNSSGSYENRKKANSSVESYESTSTVAYDPNAPPSVPTSHSTDEEAVSKSSHTIYKRVTQLTFASTVSSVSNPSLQSFGIIISSSNERSSHSLNSLSSGTKEMIFLSSSNSLSDNQELKESLGQIQESHNEEEANVEIIQQENADLRAPLSPPPPPISANHIDQTHMSPTKEQEEQEGSENLTNVENQESQQNDDNDDDEEEEEDDDDLPETQPCF
ncbi:hypothetical protein PS6_009668 [Mucor atramentarius]